MKRRSKPLPKFKSEEAEFWNTHSAADYLDQFKVVKNVRFVRRRPRLVISAPPKRRPQK
jgi:hypothetical protein